MHLVLWLVCAVALLLPWPADAAELNVVIDNLRSAKGTVFLALWNDPDGFTDSDAALIHAKRPARLGQVRFELGYLPDGAYAVAAYHDENDNGEFDTTWLGFPDEGLGFSNGAWIGFGPPSFKDASFVLKADPEGTKVHIVRVGIRYPGESAEAR